MTACAVCGSPIAEPLYRSSGGRAVTSMTVALDQDTVVYCCDVCAHLQTPPIGDLDAYYATAYRILLESEEEDQLYEVVDGQATFRAQHQAETFLRLVDLGPGARVLDYGAAKGATMRRVREARPDVAIHFYDVSDMYSPYWQKLVADDAWATFELPAEWSASFDVVTSFFMIEHVEHPADVVAAQFGLLRPGGTIYAVVPNPSYNIGDFVVVDHTNHFSGSSLERLMVDAGFHDVEVDDDAHHGAWVVQGRRPEHRSAPAARRVAVEPHLARARELAAFWSSARDRVAQAEADVAGRRVAMYGAGFYGAFIRAGLAHPDAVEAYVDQNPHLQGTEHDGRPVVAPADLDPAITDVLVGLNPLHARPIIEAIEAWRNRPLRFHYL
ncbi:MAG TPA: class I SAM-dependent methyltransferase [Acidimicrobiales bacterium]